MSQTTLRKILRCVVRLRIYWYIYYHIKGGDNAWDDLLTRWSSVHQTVRRLFGIPEMQSVFAECL